MNVALKMKKKATEAQARLENDPKAQESRKKLEEADARKRYVWRLFEEPGHSTFAACVVGFIIFCIFASTVCFCAETLPANEIPSRKRAFYLFEIFFVSVFTLEYVLRFWSTPEPKGKFVAEPMNVIDILAILPFFVELILFLIHPTAVLDLRVLRALRLVRIFKFGRYSEDLQYITEGSVRSKKSFLIMIFLLLLGLIIFSTLIWIVERGKWVEEKGCYVRENEPHFTGCSPFASVPMAFWWAITTMTTVGYGDAFPITVGGKFVGGACMIVGILCVALPTTVLGVEFAEAYSARIQEKKRGVVLKDLSSRSKDELVLYDKMKTFAKLTTELDELLTNLKYMALADIEEARAEARGSSTAIEMPMIEPTYTMLHDQSKQGFQNLRNFIVYTSGGLIA